MKVDSVGVTRKLVGSTGKHSQNARFLWISVAQASQPLRKLLKNMSQTNVSLWGPTCNLFVFPTTSCWGEGVPRFWRISSTGITVVLKVFRRKRL